MENLIKRAINKIKGREPRTWEFEKRDIPKVLQLYDKYQRTGEKEALYRLWATVYELIPECKDIGHDVGIKLRAGAVPYVEEQL